MLGKTRWNDIVWTCRLGQYNGWKDSERLNGVPDLSSTVSGLEAIKRNEVAKSGPLGHKLTGVHPTKARNV